MASTNRMEPDRILRRFRWVLGLFILALVLSGVTAFPLQYELEFVAQMRGLEHIQPTDATNGFDR